MSDRFELNGFVAVIEQEEYSENPRREFDHLGTMVCWHREYDMGDPVREHGFDYRNYRDSEALRRAILREHKNAYILPVYLYEHSGQTVSTSPFGCPFDSGQVGWIFIPREVAVSVFGNSRTKSKALKYLQGEIEEYDTYLSGDVYRYYMTGPEGEMIDSCGGYYGYESVKQEVLSLLVYYAKKQAAS